MAAASLFLLSCQDSSDAVLIPIAHQVVWYSLDVLVVGSHPQLQCLVCEASFETMPLEGAITRRSAISMHACSSHLFEMGLHHDTARVSLGNQAASIKAAGCCHSTLTPPEVKELCQAPMGLFGAFKLKEMLVHPYSSFPATAARHCQATKSKLPPTIVPISE